MSDDTNHGGRLDIKGYAPDPDRYFPAHPDGRGYQPIKQNNESPRPDNPPKGGTNVFTLPKAE